MRVTNGLWFSYPGYNEMPAGFADPRVDSNDKKTNPNLTVLEWLNRRAGFEGRVAAFASWDVLPFIVAAERSLVHANGDGPAVLEPASDRDRLLNAFTGDLPAYWADDGDTRGDACDVCPLVSDDQADQDGDGIGNACDNDTDNDTVADDLDNCPNAPNSDQANMDGDRFGNACDPDIDGDGIANAVDVRWDGQHYNDQSLTPSDDFSDHALGGRSYGLISGRGQLIILVEDASGSDQGVLISAVNGSGSGMIKQCNFKGKDASIRLEQGSVISVTCGSLSVRALARGAQIVLDDAVLIGVQQQAEARVVGLGDGEFRVENTSVAPLPVVVNLEGDVQVTLPVDGAATVSEPPPNQVACATAFTPGISAMRRW